MIRAWFKRARKLVPQEMKTYTKIESRTVKNLHTEIQRFLKEYDFELRSLADGLARVENAYVSAKNNAATICDRAVKEAARNGIIGEFGKQVTAVQGKIVAEISRWNSVVEAKRYS